MAGAFREPGPLSWELWVGLGPGLGSRPPLQLPSFTFPETFSSFFFSSSFPLEQGPNPKSSSFLSIESVHGILCRLNFSHLLCVT